MRNDFCIHPLRLVISGATVLTSVVLGITAIIIGEPVAAALLFLIALLFLWQAFIYGPWVSITPEGVRKHIFGHTLKFQSWDEIQEVGVIGTKVFNKLTPEKTGYLYIYFSPKKMTQQDRFQLALNFPPKDMIFLIHSQEREDMVQAFQSTRLVGYNTGSLKLRKDTQEDETT